MELVSNVGEGFDVLGAGVVILRVEEQVTDGVLALGGELDAKVTLGLAAEEGIGDTSHDTGPRHRHVSCISTDGTTVGHVAEEETSVGDNLVSGLTLDVAHETDTTSILLVVGIVETLGSGHGAGPELGGALYLIVTAGLEVGGGDGLFVNGRLLGVELVNETNWRGCFA